MVPAMGAEQLRSAITKPARLAGHPLDEATITLLMEDAKDREGALPLLQFALARIWDGLTRGVDPAETYRQIGGVGGALAGEAQRIYEKLDSAGKRIAKRVFLGLVQIGEGARDTRRRAEVDNLVSVVDDAETVDRIINLYADRKVRLITLSSVEKGKAETAEVTHEALFDCWDQLRGWFDEDREDIRFSRRLEEAARIWDQQGRPQGSLWQSPNLELLREYHKRAGEDMNPLQMDFFRGSHHAEIGRRALEEQQQRRRRILLRIVTVTSVATSVLAIVAGVLYRNATTNAELARRGIYNIQMLRAADTRNTGTLKTVLENGNACPVDLRDFTGGLFYGLTADPIALHSDCWHGSATFSLDGRTVAIAGGLSKDVVGLFDVATGLARWSHHTNAQYPPIAFSPNGALVASGWSKSSVAVWNSKTGNRVKLLLGHRKFVRTLAFDPSNRFLATGGEDETIILWNLSDFSEVKRLRGHTASIRSLSFSHDGTRLASASWDHTVKLWDTESWQEQATLEGHSDNVMAVSFSPNDQWLISSGRDRTTRIWNVTTHQQRFSFRLPGEVHSIAVSPDVNTVASGFTGGGIDLRDINGGRQLMTIGAGGSVTCVAFSPNGKQIAYAAPNDCVFVGTTPKLFGTKCPGKDHESFAFSPTSDDVIMASWNGMYKLELNTQSMQILSDRSIDAVCFSPSGNHLHTANEDGEVKVWDTHDWSVKASHVAMAVDDDESSLRSVAFSYDGTRVAFTSGRNVTVYEVSNWKELGRFRVGTEPNPYFSLEFLSNASLVVSSSNAVMILDILSSRTRTVQELDSWRSPTICTSADGRMLASATDRTIAIFETKRSREIATCAVHQEGDINSLEFSPDGQTLLALVGKSLVFLDPQSGQEGGVVYDAFDRKPGTAVFSRDGSKLIGGAAGRTQRAYGKPLAPRPIRRGENEQARIHRPLTMKNTTD